MISDNVSHELRTLVSDTSGELTVWRRKRVNEVRALSTANTVIDGLAARMAPPSYPGRIGARELELYLRSVQKKLDPLLELTLSDADGQVVASSAPTPAPIVLPATWPNTAITEGVVLEPPRWDKARARRLLPWSYLSCHRATNCSARFRPGWTSSPSNRTCSTSCGQLLLR